MRAKNRMKWKNWSTGKVKSETDIYECITRGGFVEQAIVCIIKYWLFNVTERKVIPVFYTFHHIKTGW